MKLFIISDTHYFHSRIIEYENRPFDDVYLYKYLFYNKVRAMNEYMIKQHNKVVTNDDIFLHFGDFSFGGSKIVKPLMERLNGKKYLILGNHDKKRTITWFYRMGFRKSFKNPIYLNNFILSHEPVDPEIIKMTRKINIHGHIHNNVHYQEFLDNSGISENYVNVAVEFLNYKPFEITDRLMKKEILDFLLTNDHQEINNGLRN